MLLTIRNFRKGVYSFQDPVSHTITGFHQPIEQKWLPNDTIDPIENTVLQRDMKLHRNIVGIVDFVNRTGQGFSPRNVPLYLFHPLDNAYPPMIVGSKAVFKINQLVTVNVEQWADKWPRAGIQTILGPVGNRDNETQALVQTMSIKKDKEDTKESQAATVFDTSGYTVFDGFVCNIDPEGCEDVDDILLWRENEDHTEFGIGIADVSAHILEGSKEDEYAQKLGETVYEDGKPVYPMLPHSVSTQQASLRSDQRLRPVLTLFFTIKDGKVQGERWERRLVKVQKAYTYESLYEDLEVAEKVKRYLQIVSDSDIGDDSHHWIEVAMVLYNSKAANVLKNKNVGIFRTQLEGRTLEEWTSLAQTTGCKELAFFGYGSGTYVYATEPNLSHKGLKQDVYCHASSPLRRYVDLYNQRWLQSILFQAKEPTKIIHIEYWNRRNKLGKLCDRNRWFVHNLSATTITEVEGFVVKTPAKESRGSNRYSLYVPIWKRKIHGKPSEEKEYEVGTKVHIRAFTDLRIPSLEERVVCSFL